MNCLNCKISPKRPVEYEIAEIDRKENTFGSKVSIKRACRGLLIAKYHSSSNTYFGLGAIGGVLLLNTTGDHLCLPAKRERIS